MKVSPQLEKIVRRCLEKLPERRFQSASDLGFALESLSAPSGSRLEAAAQRTDKSYKARREWLAWAVAAALSLITLGVIWAYFAPQFATDARVFRTSILPPERSSFEQIAVSRCRSQPLYVAE